MRIAQVAPLYESVPPKFYGGTERIVSYLAEDLVRAGHEVVLFASGDSRTEGHLVASCERAIRLDARRPDPIALHLLMIELVAKRASMFDLIHFHIDALHFPLLRRLQVPALTTLHGRLDIDGLAALYGEFRDLGFVSISASQRAPVPEANWLGTVYHGIPRDAYAPGGGTGGYLAFLGRISPEKGPERAIEIARRTGIPLRIAAKVDAADRAWFQARIEPLIDGHHVTLVGEIGEADKAAFLGDALALLFPIDWPEPFGIVMIEALACGTPVIAMRRGSVPEIVTDGVTGFIVDDVDAAVAAVRRLSRLRRADCRAAFETRFTSERMARDYLNLYECVRRQRWRRRA